MKERKNERKKNRERRESRDRTCCTRRERERDQKGQRTKGIVSTSKIADRPNLTPGRDRGQRQRQREGGLRRTWDVVSTFSLRDSKLALLFKGYHKINVIGKSTCQNLWFFFFTTGMSDASESCWRSEKKEKEKKGHHWTPESDASYPFRCPTRVGHQHDTKNGVSAQPKAQYCEAAHW